MNNSLYFDYAAATPMSPGVLQAMAPYFTDKFYNPSALYLAAQAVKQDINEARASIARTLEAKPSEVIFTAGGTESDNLAIRGVMDQFPGANCIVSAVEHNAVLAPASKYERRIAPVDKSGRVIVAELEKLIDDQTVLVSVAYVNNEIGTIQPIHEIATLLQKIRKNRQANSSEIPIYFHTDACQAANYLPLLVNGIGVDLMALNGGKIYGPKQSGILFVKTGTKLSAQILGGGQERGLRSGTENPAAIIGFAEALKTAQTSRVQESDRLTALRDYTIGRLKESISAVKINGSMDHRVANNIHITIPGCDNERLMMELDEGGIQVATGSACSASSDDPSHVLSSIGLSEAEARSSLRITLGQGTTKESINTLVDSLSSLVA